MLDFGAFYGKSYPQVIHIHNSLIINKLHIIGFLTDFRGLFSGWIHYLTQQRKGKFGVILGVFYLTCCVSIG
jgi:hypothetical protein